MHLLKSILTCFKIAKKKKNLPYAIMSEKYSKKTLFFGIEMGGKWSTKTLEVTAIAAQGFLMGVAPLISSVPTNFFFLKTYPLYLLLRVMPIHKRIFFFKIANHCPKTCLRGKFCMTDPHNFYLPNIFSFGAYALYPLLKEAIVQNQ